MSDHALHDAWEALRREERRALIPYFTAGFPTYDMSLEFLRRSSECADIVEVGVPFSDPLADGPTIQQSTFRALQGGMTLARTLQLVADARVAQPVVLFTYLNPVLQYGVERLLRDARAAGVSGLLLTDLPVGGDSGIESAIAASPIDRIPLVAPTTRPDRLANALRDARGFVYLIARLGVTGASESLAGGLRESVARVRRATPLPIAVGFGVSTPEQARSVAQVADGVVVGSALVDLLGREGVPAAIALLHALRRGIDDA